MIGVVAEKGLSDAQTPKCKMFTHLESDKLITLNGLKHLIYRFFEQQSCNAQFEEQLIVNNRNFFVCFRMESDDDDFEEEETPRKMKAPKGYFLLDLTRMSFSL